MNISTVFTGFCDIYENLGIGVVSVVLLRNEVSVPKFFYR